jgi:Uma2 family endonuclease
MADLANTKLTYDDLVALPDDGLRHELINGDHLVSPSPLLRHQAVAGRLYALLLMFVDAHPQGQVFIAPCDVILSPFDVVVPDILFVAAKHEEILTAKNVQGPPDLVVEVLSPGSRRIDEVRKYRLYQRTGVQEYWVVDPRRNRVTIHRRDRRRGGLTRGNRGFAAPLVLAMATDKLTTPLLPGFLTSLSEVFPPLPASPGGGPKAV